MADITGTNSGEVLDGTASDDRIYGLDGDDNLKGKAGSDQLFGGAGNDSLHGDAGIDFMFGGAGNDTYYVEDIGDTVSEEAVTGIDDGGTDRVYATVSYVMGNFIERATLIGTLAADLAGNNAANILRGNDSANALSGGGGNDTLEGAGGSDTLMGGAGLDALVGGLGSDTFVFGPAIAANADTVSDFATEDFVGINPTDYLLSLGAGLVLNGQGTEVLDSGYYTLISGATNTQGTVVGHGQFLFNTSTLRLLWDADGAGATSGIALATFNAGTVLGESSFKMIQPSAPAVGTISVTDAAITEGDAGTRVLTFTVSRTGTAAFDVSFATADGDAVANADYLAASGTLNFATNEMSKTVSITINGDTDIEFDETFFLNLNGATNGGTIGDGQGQATIINDDASAPVVGSVAINDVTVTEGNSGTKLLTFTVSRSGGTAGFAVDFTSTDGTAQAGADYLALSGQLNFALGEITKTISFTINGDTIVEPDEDFFVDLSGITNGGTLSDAQGRGAILNDDASAPVVGSIAINDVTVTEGNSGTNLLTFTVSRSGGTAGFAVDFATANGTALAGSDFVGSTGTLSFAAGQTSATVSITINGDTIVEPNESFFINLSAATNGGTITDPQGVGTIQNDDGAPAVINILSTTSYKSTDPSGLAYVPGLGMFLSDSEVDESPFGLANNLFRLQLNGSSVTSYSLNTPGFTAEPTGLSYDAASNRLYVVDDDRKRVFWVDPNNPSVKLGEFVAPTLANDPEDIAVDVDNGNLFIVNGLNRRIVEVTATGVQVGSVLLPTLITDPEALAYDSVNNVFYVGGGFSSNIWKVDESGSILETITFLSGYRNPVNNTRVHVKDIEIAPTSNPNDDPRLQSMYVADYGNSHVDDGRLFEIFLPGLPLGPDTII
jgi:Calx-beta domain/RTX calcium-binding nonapeptide repeat (4 copies)